LRFCSDEQKCPKSHLVPSDRHSNAAVTRALGLCFSARTHSPDKKSKDQLVSAYNLHAVNSDQKCSIDECMHYVIMPLHPRPTVGRHKAIPVLRSLRLSACLSVCLSVCPIRYVAARYARDPLPTADNITLLRRPDIVSFIGVVCNRE